MKKKIEFFIQNAIRLHWGIIKSILRNVIRIIITNIQEYPATSIEILILLLSSFKKIRIFNFIHNAIQLHWGIIKSISRETLLEY